MKHIIIAAMLLAITGQCATAQTITTLTVAPSDRPSSGALLPPGWFEGPPLSRKTVRTVHVYTKPRTPLRYVPLPQERPR